MPTNRSILSAWTPLLFTCALVAIGQAVQLNNGAFEPVAIKWLAFAALVCLAGGLNLPLPRFGITLEPVLVFVAGLGFAYQVAQLATTMPGTANPPTELIVSYQKAVVFAAVVGGAGFARQPVLGRLHPLLLVALFLHLGMWMIRVQPSPHIDVFLFQRDGVAALLAGQNPYALRYPDIYGGTSGYYGPGLSVDGKLQFGFVYPPLNLLIAGLGQALGDVRYAQLASAGLTGLIIAYARPGRVGNALAALFLFTPRGLFVIEQSWTEPFVLFGLAATAFTALRWPKAIPFVLGAFLAAKQYLVFVLPLAWLMLPASLSWRERLNWNLKVAAVVALISLPLALWNFPEFWRAVVALQALQPFRHDSLSFLAWWAQRGNPAPSTLWGFAAAAVGMGLSLWRLPRTPAGFVAGVPLTFLLFFAFSKQAFCNYYYFVMGALALAAVFSYETSPSEASSAVAQSGLGDPVG